MAFTPPPPIPDGDPDLASVRSGFADELADPEVRQQIYSLTDNEVGAQGPAAHQAFIETLFNRAQRRGQSLYQTATDRNYYPKVSFRPRLGADYRDNLLAALNGSDISGRATGNASGTVGFAGGPQTFAAGGERFGVEGPDLRRRSGFNPPPPIPDAGPPTEEAAARNAAFASGLPDPALAAVNPPAATPPTEQPKEPSTLDQVLALAKKPSPEILQGPEKAIREFVTKPSPKWMQPIEKAITSPIPGAKEAIHFGYQYGSPLGWIEDIAPESEAGKTAGRIREKLEQVGAGFASPANIGLIATGAALPRALPTVGASINRLIGAGFTAQQAKDTYQTYEKYQAATDPEEKARLKEDLMISGGLTALLGAGTLAPHPAAEASGPPPVEPALLKQLYLQRNELLNARDTSGELDQVEAQIAEVEKKQGGEGLRATKERDIEKGRQPQYQGVPPGPNLPAHQGEVREGEGGQAGGGGGIEPEAPQPVTPGQKVFGTKNALNQGIAAAEDAARREDADVWAEAEAIHADNPAAPRLLVDELAANPRPVKDFENHLVLRRQIELQKEFDAAVEKQNQNPGDPSAEAQVNAIIEEQGKVDQVNQAVGRQAGLGFRARQILADQDYNLLKMQATARAVVNKGKPLSVDQQKMVQGLHDRIKMAEGKIAEYNAREQFRQMVDARRTDPTTVRQPGVAGKGRLTEKTAFLQDAYNRAKQRIVERRGRLHAGIDPTSFLDEAIVGAYHIERGLTKFADWSAQMIKDLGEQIKPYLQDLWKRSRDYHADTTKGLGRVRGKMERTPERVLRADKRRVARDIEKYQERVSTGDISPLRPRPKARPTDKELSGLMFEREQAKTAYHEMLVKAKLKQQSLGRKGIRYFGEGLRTARSIKTAFDVSGVLRQGGFNYFAHPIQATRALSVIAKAVRSEKGAFQVMQEIRDRPNFPLYKQAGLFLSEEGGMNLSKMEEVFASRLARKIPGVGASERMYTAYLNRIRADRFDSMAGTLSRFGKLTEGEAKAIANFVNETTGRGYLPARMQGAAEALNAAFFAPRFVISRFQTLLGHPIWQLERASPRVRALIAFEYVRTLTGIGLFIAAATQAGAKIETDPRSTDFMKLRFGNVRIDPMVGIQQVGVFLSRILSGSKKSSTGKVMPLRGELKFGQASAADVIARFAWTKLGPAPGSAVNVLAGQDPTGRPTTLVNEALHFAAPLGPQDMLSTMQANGVPLKLALALLAAGGMGVSAYSSTSTGQHAAIRKRMERRDRALLSGDLSEALRLSQ